MKTDFYLPISEENVLVCRMLDYEPDVAKIDGYIYLCSSVGEDSSLIMEAMIRNQLKTRSNELLVKQIKLSAKEYGYEMDEQIRQYKEYSNNFFKRIYG